MPGERARPLQDRVPALLRAGDALDTKGYAMSAGVDRQDRNGVGEALRRLAAERILVLDGAMGTQIQDLRFSEAEFRKGRFEDWPRDLKGNNDLLVLTQPDAIRDIHLAYFTAGADIAETNT